MPRSMKRYATVLAVLLVVAGAAGVVAGDEGPLAAAGLDQEVGVDTTVQLDGTGSSHPDGRIEGYEWSIETPDGRTVTPDCRTCARTQFTPRSVGRYDVTLTVTDGEGRTDSDTLYIYVEEAGPTVELNGDTEPRGEEPATYNASARATDADLESLMWKMGNRTVARAGLSGSTDSAHREFGFTDSGPYRLVVVVQDASNRTARDVLMIEPQDSRRASGGDSGGTKTAISDFGTAADGGYEDEGCEKAAVVGNPTGSGPPAAVTCADGRDQEDIDKWADETCSSDLRDCEYVDPDGLNADRNTVSNDGVRNPSAAWNSISRGDNDDAGLGGLFGSGPSRSKVSAGGNSRGGYVI